MTVLIFCMSNINSIESFKAIFQLVLRLVSKYDDMYKFVWIIFPKKENFKNVGREKSHAGVYYNIFEE